MSQNRQEEKDRQRAENDYLINLKAEIEVRKDQIMTLAIASDLMPPGNLTGITEAERDTIARWYAGRTSRPP